MQRRRSGQLRGPGWIWMAVFAAIFVGLGLAVVVGAFFASDGAGVLAAVGLGFAVVGLIPAFFTPRAYRQWARARDLVTATPGAPGPQQPLERPWPVAAVASALTEAFRDTPYGVEHNADTIVVEADLVDQKWQVLATQRSLHTALSVRLSVTRPGRFDRNDTLHEVAWHAGVPSLGATLRTSSGRVWRYQGRIELGTGRRGVTKPVDVSWSTGEVNRRIREVLGRAGWRTGLDPTAKGALVMAGIGGVGAALTPIVLLVQWLVDR